MATDAVKVDDFRRNDTRAEGSAVKKMRLCVLSGCQMDGLVSALRVLFPRFEIEGFHTYRLLGDDRSEIHARLRAADLVFTMPLDGSFADLSFDRIGALGPRIQFIPQVVFSGFHPDLTYLQRLDGTYVQTKVMDYNSIIAVSAYLIGLSLDQTIRLYNTYTYQALGYLDSLDNSRESLLSDFAPHRIDLRGPLVRWLGEPEPFMYSVNHPKSFVLADVALEASRAADLDVGPAFEAFDLLPDRLSQWVVYPVFTEIAKRLGKVGDYQFKSIESVNREILSLDAFVADSFARYNEEDLSQWLMSKRMERTKTIISQMIGRNNTKRAIHPIGPQERMMTYAVARNVETIEDCYFYHTTDLPQYGTQYGGWDLRGRFADYIGGLDLTGQRVLDVGTASGFLSFSAEEAGAKEVVSFDLDTADRQHLLPFAGSEYVTDHASWSAKQTAAFQKWKNAYWFTHRLRNSKAKVVYGDVYAMPEAIGQFDVVILGAILEHLADPIRALASVARHSRKYIVINTDYISTDEPMAQFNGRPECPDSAFIFWTYSLKTYEHVMGILGYEIIKTKKDTFAAYGTVGGPPIEAERVVLVCRKKDTTDAVSQPSGESLWASSKARSNGLERQA